MRANKRAKILAALATPDNKTSEGFKAFDSGVSKLKDELKQTIQIGTLAEVNKKLEGFKKGIDLAPLTEGISALKSSFQSDLSTLTASLGDKLSEVLNTLDTNNETQNETLNNEVEDLKQQIADVVSQKTKELQQLRTDLTNADTALDKISATKVKQLNDLISSIQDDFFKQAAALSSDIDTLNKALPKLRTELVSMIASKGGGSMNRKITFGGVDYLTRYTDINYKAGANVTFTVATNNQTKMVDVTIAATGGGGGTVRSINSVSTATAAGSTAGTDYVYLVSGTTTITLPTAVGNTNLYTVKNVGSGVVTIATTASQTIDGTLTITMPLQYTAVDLISDTANWNVT